MHDADRAAEDLGGAISHADANTLIWSKDLRELHSRLKGVNKTASDLGPSLLQVAKVGMEFRKTNGGVIGFTQALTRAGVATTIFDILKSKILGTAAAMAALPPAAKKIVQISNSFRLMTFAIGTLTALAAKTGIFGKIYISSFVR